MDDKQFKSLDDKIDKITKLLTVIALKDKEKEQDKIELLDLMGFKTTEIARVLNKSPQNVSTVLGNLRKKTPQAIGPEVKQTTEAKQPEQTLQEKT